MKKIKSRTILNIGFAVFVFMICNFAVSIFATVRYCERHYDIAPDSVFEGLIDKRFPDERMQKIYYNMEFVDK